MTGADGMNRRTTETDMPVMQDKELTPQELVQYVRDICDAEALELMLRGNRVYIPYMMSDAVEAWCVLEDAEVPEDMPEDTEDVIDAVALCAEGRQGRCGSVMSTQICHGRPAFSRMKPAELSQMR